MSVLFKRVVDEDCQLLTFTQLTYLLNMGAKEGSSDLQDEIKGMFNGW